MKKITLCLFICFLSLNINFGQKHELSRLPLQIGHRESVNEVFWSPDNTKLLSHSSPDTSIRVWDVKTGKQLWSVNTGFIQRNLETYTLNSFDWSLDGKYIASTGYNGLVQVWDADDGKLLWNINAHSENGQVVRFTPDSQFLVSIGERDKSFGQIKLWNVETGSLVREFDYNGKAKIILEAKFSKNGRILTTGSFDGQIVNWNVSNGSRISSNKFNPCGNLSTGVRGFSYNADLTKSAGRCGDKTVITDTRSGKTIRILGMRGDWEKEVGFSRNGNVLVLTDVGFYKVLNLKTNDTSRIDNVIGSGFTYALNNDGSLIAEGGGYRAEGIQITNVRSGEAVRVLESHPGIIEALSFNSDGSKFSSGSSDRLVRIFDAKTKEILLTFSGHTASIKYVNFNLDGKTLTSKSEKETIVWDLETSQIIRKEKTGVGEIDELKEKVISPNRKFILEDSGDDKPFEIRNMETYKTTKIFGLSQIQGFKFSPQSDTFISASYFKPLQLWKTETGEKLIDFNIGYSFHNIVTFSPDGHYFVTGGWNQNILFYEIRTGALLWSLFPIDEIEMKAEVAEETRRIRFLKEKANAEKLADLRIKSYEGLVKIEFSHFGNMSNPGDKKMMESDEPKESKLKKTRQNSNAVWLQLRNDSQLPIKIPTQSMFFRDPKCFFAFPNGVKINGLCDNREINIWHGLKDKNGEWIPFGFDFGSSAFLLPKTSVLFPVPLSILKDGNSIGFSYEFQNTVDGEKIDGYGTAKELSFGENDLPK